ncbi:methyltransferase [Flavobacterium magnum]|uniref:Methyltransferase n=1 Tax=Flavobacterium magnum TaxID=2162713 RepID=A0A2S0RFC5_9FLAO|nr:class I SAM-dependent methyltransferase [Flavobacterium magnum]AWA29791.1 methyltransferase [Flavobacterium magnum]
MKTTSEILEINKKQKEFYNHIRQNRMTRIWAKIRNGVLNRVRKNIGIHDQVYDLHKVWFGDLSDKKVLDLGCFSGNNLSFYLAEHSKSYLGIDLSDKAISHLKEKIKKYPNAEARAVDFLSDEFSEADFDLIYAYGVLHHFPNVDVLIERLNEKLSPNGAIISYDPLQTSTPIWILRTLYRPFQSDAAWEWPFTRRTYRKFAASFRVIERHGLLGKSKWIVLLNMLPLSQPFKNRTGRNWHQQDWKKSAISDKDMFRCMHLTMWMQKQSR